MAPLLNNLEYSVTMQAIELAKYEHQEGQFVDQYDPERPTDEEVTEALATAEQKLMNNYLQPIKS